MIITKLNGGLGNQMFEYAHARSLQLDNNDDLYLDIEGFEHWNPKYPKRSYSLSCFNIPDCVSVLPIQKSRKLIVWQALSKINRVWASRIAKLFHVYLWKNPNFYDYHIKSTKGHRFYFYGYWQSEKYFNKYRDIIKSELKVKSEVLPDSIPYLELANRPNSVCIHIRRGDYVVGNMVVCSEDYYLKGIQYIRNIHRDCNVLVFTDDIEWVKTNIHFDMPVSYVTIDNPDYEVLRIMYSCKHFVISNSSFSWWAQYLSDNTEKIVIAPNIWFPNQVYDNSIYLDEWIRYDEVVV